MALSAETSISIMLLLVSFIYFLFPPKNINYFYGYRTRRSMKSKTHWSLANKWAPRMMIVMSVFDAVLGYVVADLFNYDFLYIFLILLIAEFGVVFYLIERKLKKVIAAESAYGEDR